MAAPAWRRWWWTAASTSASLPQSVAGTLAAYARPIFLRLRREIEVTGTFKQRKVDLVKEGFDPGRIPDPIYWFDLRDAAR